MGTVSYAIKDRSGVLVATHERIEANGRKEFRWLLHDGTVGLSGFPLSDLPLYGIDRMGKTDSMIVVEGEKAADALLGLGLPAVGTVTGASATPGRAALSELDGLHVWLWPDNDDVGLHHMERVEAGLKGIALDVNWVIQPEDAPKGWDAADVADGGGYEAVRAMLMRQRGPVDYTYVAVTGFTAEERENLIAWLAMLIDPMKGGDSEFEPHRTLIRALTRDLRG